MLSSYRIQQNFRCSSLNINVWGKLLQFKKFVLLLCVALIIISVMCSIKKRLCIVLHKIPIILLYSNIFFTYNVSS